MKIMSDVNSAGPKYPIVRSSTSVCFIILSIGTRMNIERKNSFNVIVLSQAASASRSKQLLFRIFSPFSKIISVGILVLCNGC